MANKKKIIKYNFNAMKLLPLFMAVIVILVTLGYATVSDNLSVIGGKAFVRIDKTIRLTDFSLDSVSNNATSNYDKFSYKNAYSTISLPNSNSAVIYNIQVTNLGNAEMGLTAINNLPSNLKYSLIGYNLEATLCDSVDNTKCSLGSVTNFQLKIEYDTNGYDGVTTSYNLALEFIFEEMLYTARIGQTKYLTIQDAIDASPTDGTETTIVLLKNVYQRIQVWRGNNIVLDMPNLVLHNLLDSPNANGDPVVEIFGARDITHKNSDTNNVGVAIFKMINGTILTDSNQAAVNAEQGGRFIMTGGTIIATGARQAVYMRNGGSVEISGTAYLKASAQVETNKPRGTVHNASGTLTITGGTIEAVGTNGIALFSEATTTVGTQGGGVSTTSPSFIGESTGINIKTGTTFNYYDGVAKGKVNAFVNESEIDAKETGYVVVHSAETINNNTYLTAFLSNNSATITFDPGNGSVSEVSRVVAAGIAIGPLPVPTLADYRFTGWYDSNDNLMAADSTVSGNETLTAHWVLSDTSVCRIGTAKYDTLAEALSQVPANTETTITITRDIELDTAIKLPATYNLVVDLNDHTINTSAGTIFETTSGTILKIDDNGPNGTGAMTGGMVSGGQVTVIKNVSGGTVYIRGGTISSNKAQVIDNNGTMHITGGKITIDYNQGVINNNGGAVLNMSGGEIVVPKSGSRRQAIYNKGTVNISGTASLSSASSDRATLQNDASGARITISGGTIVSTNVNCERGAVQNGSGTLVVTGGTIISNSTKNAAAPSGIQNAGTCIIGVEGGGIDITSPVIRGVRKGIYNTGTLNIYDGVLQSPGTPLDGSTNVIEQNSAPVTNDTALIGGVTYNLWYLQSTS